MDFRPGCVVYMNASFRVFFRFWILFQISSLEHVLQYYINIRSPESYILYIMLLFHSDMND